MLGVLRKRWNRKQILDMKTEEDDKEELQDVAPPPSYIRISDGKVSLVQPLSCDTVTKDKEVLEERIVELEEALLRLQEKVNNSQCGSPTFERDLREQLENMNRAMKSKDRKTVQACRDNKALQARFARQEALLHNLQQENKALTLRIRQYDRCLDDVMRKVVDAIVLEDSLRQEVAVLKSRVYELEAQNAALSASPAKGKDEGYCTMSSGQPQPSNGHLEDLPEEPEQWLLPAEPCSTEMEDWSMSQDELGVITLDDEVNDQEHERDHEHDWIWNTSDFLNSTMIASQSEGISRLLQQTIVYSEDEEVACVDFTKDFYKLVNIPSGSTRSLYSYLDAETDDEDDTTSENCRTRGPSPTPSEAGRAQVTSCSSSESEEHTRCILELPELVSSCSYEEPACILRNNNNQRDEVDVVKTSVQSEETTPTNGTPVSVVAVTTTTSVSTPTSAPVNSGPSWRRSNGWKRLPSLESPKKEMRSEKPSPTSLSPSTPPISRIPTSKQSSPIRKSKIPPPVPVRRSYAS